MLRYLKATRTFVAKVLHLIGIENQKTIVSDYEKVLKLDPYDCEQLR